MTRTVATGLICLGFLIAGAQHGWSEDLTTLREENYRKRGIPEFDDAVLRYLRGERPKVFGGDPAPLGSYSWQVSISNKWLVREDPVGAHFCGGFIVKPTWILTAAHCVRGPVGDYIVRAGSHRLTPTTPKYEIKRPIIHPDYTYDDTGRQDSDIALVELQQPIVLGQFAATIPLPPVDANEDDILRSKELNVAGWGGVSSSGPQVRDLLAIKLAYVDRDTCNKPLAFDSRVSTRMICAGATAADACGADSGGALSTAGLNPVAYGIVSWGGDCQDGRYGVYTRVSFFSKWVDDCVNGRASCRRRR